MTKDLDALAHRADQLTRRLEVAAASRLRAREVSDPRRIVTLEMDDRNELAHVKVSNKWTNLSGEEFSAACVHAYQALGDAILNDWAEALTADEGETDGAAVPRRQTPEAFGAVSPPPDDVLMSAMERTAHQFAQLEKLEVARVAGELPPVDDAPVVGRSRDEQVMATFTPDGMLTGVDVAPTWSSGSTVRLGEAIAEAIRDAVAQGEAREAGRRNPYAELSAQFAASHAQSQSMLRRSGLI